MILLIIRIKYLRHWLFLIIRFNIALYISVLVHSVHKCDFNNLFDKLVLTLKEAAITSVKQKRAGLRNPYWSEELNNLKRLAMNAHYVREAHGCPIKAWCC